MANWASQGHNMRRRAGNPTNHLESAGKKMVRSHMTADEHHAAAAAAGSHRITVGAATPDMSVYGQMDEINPGQMQGTLVPKKSTQAMDPTAGGKANRTNVENIGATYRISPKVTFMQLDPAAGPTMQSAKIVPSVQGRSNPNFESGIQYSGM